MSSAIILTILQMLLPTASLALSGPVRVVNPPDWTYIPFITPMHFLQPWWYLLLLPLAFGISLVYKAMHLSNLDRLLQSTLVMTLQIVLAVIALGIALIVVVQVLIPLIPVE